MQDNPYEDAKKVLGELIDDLGPSAVLCLLSSIADDACKDANETTDGRIAWARVAQAIAKAMQATMEALGH